LAWAGLGSVQFIGGRGEQAEESFRKAIALEPDNPDLHYNLANVLVLLKRSDEAEQELRTSLKLDPSSAGAHLNLGVLLLNRMAVTEAQQHLQAASRLGPRLASPHLHLGRIASAQYRYVDARRHYQDFLQRSSDAQEKQRVEGILAQLEQRAVEQEQARARGEFHLLQLMVTTREEADRAVQRARAGEDFYQLAENLSRIASVTGVDVGYVAPSSLNAEFRGAVAPLKVGQVTDALPGRNGFYVFKRID
jgi:tetratricopeptide (TPR) repeat protein